jgi:hypothetical protein
MARRAERHLSGLGSAIGVIVVLEAITFLIAALLHGGVEIPIGIVEPVIVPAMIVEGIIGIAFAAAAFTIFIRKGRSAWALTLTAHIIATVGVLLGMVAAALGPAPATDANELYHRIAMGVAALMLLFLFTRAAKDALNGFTVRETIARATSRSVGVPR